MREGIPYLRKGLDQIELPIAVEPVVTQGNE
jgi:hypothetical protein